MENQKQEAQLAVEYYFPVPIYSIEKPEFLEGAKSAAQEYVEKAQAAQPDRNEIYPIYQTENFQNDERVKDLTQYILDTAWNVLDSQGYNMENLRTYFQEFWCQDHAKHSAMEQHIHGFNAQIVGFYFIECPEDCSRVVFHDPKAAKVQIGLPEKNAEVATAASNMINFQPKPGLLMLTNAWLAHSFTRCGATENMRFIHFTVVPQYVAPQTCLTPAAEVI